MRFLLHHRFAALAALVLCVLGAGLAFAQSDGPGRRVALVVAVGDYDRMPRLAGPGTDAPVVATALREAGFETEVVKDPTRAELLSALARHRTRSAGADVGLIYLSGSGASIGGVDVFLPKDAPSAGTLAKALDGAVEVDAIVRTGQAARALSIIVVDAGRDVIPQSGLFTTSGPTQMPGFGPTRGLRPANRSREAVQLPPESLVIYSASPGGALMDAAADGSPSPFAAAFARRIAEPGDILRIAGRIGEDVRIVTSGGQTPVVTVSGMHGKPFCLAGCDDTAVPSNAALLASATRPYCRGEWTAQAGKEGRLALIIAESAYTGPRLSPLASPAIDARNVEGALESAGFAVRVCSNQTFEGMQKEKTDFVAAVQRSVNARRGFAGAAAQTSAFFYFSGHGFGAPSGQSVSNYLVPVGLKLEFASQLPGSALEVSDVAKGLTATGADAVFIVIDACREAFVDSQQRAAEPVGLLEEGVPEGALIAFSTGPRRQAADSTIYSTVLSAHLRARPGRDARLLFNAVGNEVRTRTDRAQSPWYDPKNLTIDTYHFQPPV